jgi:hypothetical protein
LKHCVRERRLRTPRSADRSFDLCRTYREILDDRLRALAAGVVFYSLDYR